MKTIVSRLALLLTGASLACLTPAAASNPNFDDQEQHLSFASPAFRDVLPLAIRYLSWQDTGHVAAVCKTWQNAQGLSLNKMFHRAQTAVLFDHKTDHLSAPYFVTQGQNTYVQNGVVFMLFEQYLFPKGSQTLTTEDVASLIPRLYKHAFHGKKTTFSPQDLLCLEAVLPWQRMAYNPTKPDAKQKALALLQGTQKNPHLVRFTPDLPVTAFEQDPHTFVLTTTELRDHKDALDALLKTPSFHHVHLVAEEGGFVQNGSFKLSNEDMTRNCHLTLSDPHKIVIEIDDHFLYKSREISFLHFKHFPALRSVKSSFLAHTHIADLKLNFPTLLAIGSYFLEFSFFPQSENSSLILRFPSLETVELGLLYRATLNAVVIDCPNLTRIGYNSLSESSVRSAILSLPSLRSLSDFMTYCSELETLQIKNLNAVVCVTHDSFLNRGSLNDSSRQQLATFYQHVLTKPEGYISSLTKVPSSFSPSSYLLYNPDIQTFANSQGINPLYFAQEHYREYGFKEVRRYRPPSDFDVETYFLFNDDIKTVALSQKDPHAFAIWHFITHAAKEGRLYKFELPRHFTPAGYLAKNPDLEDYARSGAEKERDNKLKVHYTRYGQHEGRQF
ncbi:MAG: hypothetical protein H2057_01495 [Alphaproteobacteria bacterium]|nr:hypothetical protein [Alphaproteobacteria bacterium]